MDFLLLFVEVIASLLIALAILWIDRRLRDNDDFDSIMDGLIGELCQNLSIVRTQKVGIDGKVDLMKKGGWNRTPDPLLSNDAYHRAVASEVFFRDMRKNSEGFVRILMEHYASQEVMNEEIRQLNQAKFDYLIHRDISVDAFEVLFGQQKATIEKVIEPSIVSLLIMVSSIKAKYGETIRLYVNLPS
jgi:hypothetical protein